MRERKEGTEDWREEREERKGCNDISMSKNPKETSKEENRRLEWKINWKLDFPLNRREIVPGTGNLPASLG